MNTANTLAHTVNLRDGREERAELLAHTRTRGSISDAGLVLAMG